VDEFKSFRQSRSPEKKTNRNRSGRRPSRPCSSHRPQTTSSGGRRQGRPQGLGSSEGGGRGVVGVDRGKAEPTCRRREVKSGGSAREDLGELRQSVEPSGCEEGADAEMARPPPAGTGGTTTRHGWGKGRQKSRNRPRGSRGSPERASCHTWRRAESLHPDRRDPRVGTAKGGKFPSRNPDGAQPRVEGAAGANLGNRRGGGSGERGQPDTRHPRRRPGRGERVEGGGRPAGLSASGGNPRRKAVGGGGREGGESRDARPEARGRAGAGGGGAGRKERRRADRQPSRGRQEGDGAWNPTAGLAGMQKAENTQ
jgi:hypothetical protein